jgi:hypothetical protein
MLWQKALVYGFLRGFFSKVLMSDQYYINKTINYTRSVIGKIKANIVYIIYFKN